MSSPVDDLPPLPASTACSDTSNRIAQILDEEDHKRCTDGNKAALVAESMARLRLLLKDIEQDNWKYSYPNDGQSSHR